MWYKLSQGNVCKRAGKTQRFMPKPFYGSVRWLDMHYAGAYNERWRLFFDREGRAAVAVRALSQVVSSAMPAL